MKLYYAPQSPFARKVRIVAAELGLSDRLELEYAHVVPGKPNPTFASGINPLRKIPALLLRDGSVLYDSSVICQFLQELSCGPAIYPLPCNEARWQILTEHAIAQGVCEALILIRYEKLIRPAKLQSEVWIEDQFDKIWKSLDYFQRSSHSLKRQLDVAHIALGCALGYLEFRFPFVEWRSRFDGLSGWFEGLCERSSFLTTRPCDPAEGS